MGFVFRPISIHAPHTGRDLTQSISRICITQFQSTRPIRGATRTTLPHNTIQFISIHAPHTGRDDSGSRIHFVSRISIHAPHTGRDVPGSTGGRASRYFNPRAPYGARLMGFFMVVRVVPNFNPRAPYGARPGRWRPCHRQGLISIHAPHTGRDKTSFGHLQ